MTKEQLQQLKTICTWLEQFANDVQVIVEPEQAVLDRMPPGFTEVKLKDRVAEMVEAARLIEEAHSHLVRVAFDDGQQIMHIET